MLWFQLIFISFQINRALASPSLSAGEAKNCLASLEAGYFAAETALPGIDDHAQIALCQDAPSAKLSSDFSQKELTQGTPIQASEKMILLYATAEGFRFAEYPSFYYFVFYHDESNAIDVGVLPSHVMPIQLPKAAQGFFYQDGPRTGTWAPLSDLDPSDQTHYLDRYQILLKKNKLPKIELKATSSLTDEQIRQCVVKAASSRLWSKIEKMNFSPQFTDYRGYEDEVAAQTAATEDLKKFAELKAKYKMNPDEWVQYYVQKAKLIDACNPVFHEEDYEQLVRKELSYFLPDYTRTKTFIDSH